MQCNRFLHLKELNFASKVSNIKKDKLLLHVATFFYETDFNLHHPYSMRIMKQDKDYPVDIGSSVRIRILNEQEATKKTLVH